MIDDDVQNLLRRMLEQLFGDAVGSTKDGTSSFGFNFGFESRAGPLEEKEEEVIQPDIEKIELDDRMIVLISGFDLDQIPTVKIIRQMLVIVDPNGVNDEIMDLPYPIHVEESIASVRNGVVEINLIKAKDREHSSETGEHILKII